MRFPSFRSFSFLRSLHFFPSLILAVLVMLSSPLHAAQESPQTIIVTAEGLADPGNELYSKDRGLLVDDLRRDARRQVIEKAVGTYVDSSTLVENYLLIEDRVLTKSSGLIKRVIEESNPEMGDDGLMHLQLTAEVFISDVKKALDTLSKEQRLSLLKERGNPTISVAIVVRDAARGESSGAESSPIAENILKEHFSNFGYRVWSEDYTKLLQREAGSTSGSRRVADFSVIGEAKFKKTSLTLKASGLTVTKHALTSWTVKCINNHTGEEVYFNNKVPHKKAWANEDQALEDIGTLIGDEFSKDFFESRLMSPSRRFQIHVKGLPDYDMAQLFQKEFIGLRNILNIELINFETGGLTQFEADCSGSGSSVVKVFNQSIIKPLNAKLGSSRLKLAAFHGNVVRIDFDPGSEPDLVKQTLTSAPPSSLAMASQERINSLISSVQVLNKILQMNPQLKGGNTTQ